MTAQFVLTSRFPLQPDTPDSLFTSLKDDYGIRFLVDLECSEILQLRAYKSLLSLSKQASVLEKDLEKISTYLAGDVRRELLTYIEAPKPSSMPLPQSDYIQLRHIEVLPSRTQAYRQWREKSIFEVIRESTAIDTFTAYHSLISGQPGVMFITGFSGNPETYHKVFQSPRYQAIVKEAGDQYITDGEKGLYTRVYTRPTKLRG